jgi:hypothetical protein
LASKGNHKSPGDSHQLQQAASSKCTLKAIKTDKSRQEIHHWNFDGITQIFV